MLSHSGRVVRNGISLHNRSETLFLTASKLGMSIINAFYESSLYRPSFVKSSEPADSGEETDLSITQSLDFHLYFLLNHLYTYI